MVYFSVNGRAQIKKCEKNTKVEKFDLLKVDESNLDNFS
jgi:hypothetical protein